MSLFIQLPAPTQKEEDEFAAAAEAELQAQCEPIFAEPEPIVSFDINLRKKSEPRTKSMFSLENHPSVSKIGNNTLDPEDSRSIEIFFGSFANFKDCYKYVWNGGNGQRVSGLDAGKQNAGVPGLKLIPETVRKLILVGHPLNSFYGIDKFPSLVELLVTNSSIRQAKCSDFEGLEQLQKLFIYNIGLEIMEPLKFNSIKVLWLAGNKLRSLSFLTQGLSTLHELNVAKNEIVSISEQDLLQSSCLSILNLSGNPLCTVQDIQSLRILPALKDLYLCDPVYGKCPIASLCDSRNILVYTLSNVACLDGKPILPSELKTIKEYMHSRALFYYANSFSAIGTQIITRKSAINLANKKLEKLGQRMQIVMALGAKYRRSITNLDINPIFTNAKSLLKEHLVKLDARLAELRHWSYIILERWDTINLISRWEIKMKAWMKMVEFTSSGTIQCSMIQSVHGALNADANTVCGSIHETLSCLSCSSGVSKSSLLKIENAIVVKDFGHEAGMQLTYNNNFVKDKEPEFILPEPVDEQISLLSAFVPNFSSPSTIGAGYPYISNPLGPQKPVETYMDPEFKYTPPLIAFPEGVPGLVQKSRPIYMYLICPRKGFPSPLTFFHRIVNGRSTDYKSIRLTNCLSIATAYRSGNISIVILVKVLPECLQFDKRMNGHHFDCGLFSLKHPLCMTPAYILTISFVPKEKDALWQYVNQAADSNDDDVLGPAKTALTTLTENSKSKNNMGLVVSANGFGNIPKSKRSPYIRKTVDGVLGDLSCSHLYINEKGELLSQIQSSSANIPIPQTYYVQSVSKYLGTEGSKFVTTLDISGNSLGMVVGLDGLNNLKKLNLSHNKLKTLSTLQKVPQLIEFKVGWNAIRNFHNSVICLKEAFPNLMTLEILPNPFTDIRDYAHIPVILKRSFHVLNRVDIWKSPFEPSKAIGTPYEIGDDPEGITSDEETVSNEPPPIPGPSQGEFETIPLTKSWIGSSFVVYNELASKCLTDLKSIPSAPPFPEGFATNGMDLDLSDNYLNSSALSKSSIFQSEQWKFSLVKLQLQENRIENLNWLESKPLPNLQILNLSNNSLTEMTVLAGVVQDLKHLQVSGNPFPCDTLVLAPIRMLQKLITLDCSNSPLSAHPEYGSYVTRFCSSVEILDGQGISHWELGETVENFGGTLTTDWLEEKFRSKNLTNVSELSLTNYNIQKVSVSSQSLSKLTTIGLQNNYLTNFSSLSSLPNLRVLCVSHNSILHLGPGTTCPTCFEHTAKSQAGKLLRTKLTENQFSSTALSPPPSANSSARKVSTTKSIFPKLEVLIMSHNGLNHMSDLHLHALPQLRTIIFNCNNLTSPVGLDNLPTVKIIVLDNNRISSIPPNSFSGCVSLRYLHLESNRLTSLPKLPNLSTITALHVGYNKIQSLADTSSLSPLSITDLSLIGNPLANRSDYRMHVAVKYPELHTLDGKELATERVKLHEVSMKAFPGLIQQTTQEPLADSPSPNTGLKWNHPNSTNTTLAVAGTGTGLPGPLALSLRISSPALRKRSSKHIFVKESSAATNATRNIRRKKL